MRRIISEEQVALPYPLEQVWAIISAFGAIKAWMPTVTFCSTTGNDVGSVRSVRQGDIFIQEELKILDWDRHRISYEFLEPTGMPMKRGYGTISLTSADDGKATELAWTADAEEDRRAECPSHRLNTRTFHAYFYPGLGKGACAAC